MLESLTVDESRFSETWTAYPNIEFISNKKVGDDTPLNMTRHRRGWP